MGTGEFTAVHGSGVQAMATPLNLIHDGIVCEPIGNLETSKSRFCWMFGNLETPKGRFCWMFGNLGARKGRFCWMIANFGGP